MCGLSACYAVDVPVFSSVNNKDSGMISSTDPWMHRVIFEDLFNQRRDRAETTLRFSKYGLPETGTNRFTKNKKRNNNNISKAQIFATFLLAL